VIGPDGGDGCDGDGAHGRAGCFSVARTYDRGMCPTIEVSEEFRERVDSHCRDDETPEEFLTEILNHYESEGNPLWEGYGGPP